MPGKRGLVRNGTPKGMALPGWWGLGYQLWFGLEPAVVASGVGCEPQVGVQSRKGIVLSRAEVPGLSAHISLRQWQSFLLQSACPRADTVSQYFMSILRPWPRLC